MAMASLAWFCFVLLLLLHSLSVLAKQTFIVHMNYHLKPLSYSTHHDWYTAHLLSLLPDSSLLYTYTTAFHGFAAALDPDQAESLHHSDAVLGVYEDSIYTLHTTRTPKFLGLETDLGLRAGRRIQDLEQASQDVIIGVLDTGVWPESKSFDDTGMAEVPPRWRGKCESGVDFSPSLCNKKLIGARSFSEGFRMASGESSIMQTKENQSARDRDGHGTHTASTAVGAHVANASLLGYAGGTARGMATRARVAVYKVCWSRGCVSSDILAGMDRAIVDGVDVLSLSLGSGAAAYYNDMIAIGAFTAMEKGIFVSCSAGNSGPRRTTLSNEAPWITTVGAGTLDRDFPAYAQLGNGSRVAGASLYSGTGMGTKPVGLVYGNGNSSSSEMCLRGSLEPGLVRGKVVVCDRGSSSRTEKGLVVRNAGGVGVIITNTAVSGGEDPIADSHLIPAVNVGKKVGDLIKAYAQSDANPTALLTFGGTVLDVRPSPVVASFSSRGPSWVTPYILKPDLIGPGVNILAAWSGLVGPTNLEIDTRRTQFNIISGTLMSCPHITGLAALLKAAHPDWSPSAIKSALMTTAYTHDNTKAPIRDAAAWGAISNPWAYGSGHVDPQKALSPGLVYNASAQDYIAFLCTLGYDTEQMQIITKRSNIRCSQRFTDPGGLNYPSFAVVFNNTRIVQYTRELTNVGPAGSVYNVTVGGPSIVTVTVKPTKLVFSEVGVKLRYTVTFLAKRGLKRMTEPAFGWLAWSNEQHRVRSPVSYQWVGV